MSPDPTVTVSMFGPYAPDAQSALRPWLSNRCATRADQNVEEMALPVAVPLPGALGGLRLVHLILPAWRATRAYRSTNRRIGLYVCDEAALANRRYGRALAIRGLLAALTVAAGIYAGIGWRPAALLGTMAWAVSGWITPAAWLTAAVTGTFAVIDGRVPALVGLFVAANAALGCRRFLALAETGFQLYGGSSADPVRFLGRWMLLRALYSKRTASLMLTVDKVTHDDRLRARFFVEDCTDRLPARWEAVLQQCEALLEAAERRFQDALVLSQTANTTAATAPAAIRGWCALQFGDVLLASGNPAAAESKWHEAAALLAGSRDRFWRAQTDLRLAQALTGDASDTERVVRGLQILCRLRTLAVRRIDFGLLQRTEFLLLRLMHAQGNTEGVREHLAGTAMSQLKNDKVMIGTSVGEHAMKLLLKASIAVDGTGDAPPAAAHAALQEAAESIGAALRHLSRTRQPILAATAYAAMARVQALLNQPEAALANTLESLQAIQYVRYQLPTTSWRADWLRTHRHVYTLALDLAAGNPGLVGELLEVVRAQSVPLERDAPGAWTRSVLDALTASIARPPQNPRPPSDAQPPADPAGPEQRVPAATADPLLTGQTFLVQQASWLGGDATGVIDVDDELAGMFPGAWYWSLAKTEDWIYHAIRTPEGTWLSERRPYADARAPLDDLLRHLPVHLPGETTRERKKRLADSVLLFECADQAGPQGLRAGEVWDRLFDHLGRTLLPQALRRVLSNATDQPLPLVIAPTGVLALVPFAAVSVTAGVPLMERAALTHLPAIALLAARRRADSDVPATTPDRQRTEVLAVLAPHLEVRVSDPDDAEDVDLYYALHSAPPGAESVLGRMTKRELAASLAHRRSADTVLYLAGHVDASAIDDPAGTGFRLHGGHLTLRDFYKLDHDGRPVYRVPERVLLGGCASLGLYPDTTVSEEETFAAEPEWLGLGAAMVYGGARHVYCSLFRVLDCPYTVRIDLALVRALRRAAEPAQALRAAQLAELQRWRDGSGAVPIVFLAYVYVGLGM